MQPSVGLLISQLGFKSSQRFADRLEPLDLNPRTFALLRHIDEAEGSSQHELAEALGVPPSRMVALLDELEAAGLVERRPHPSDRRARSLYLTRKGRRLLEKAVEVAAEHEADLCADLTATERKQLLEMLGRVADTQGLRKGVHPALGLKVSGPPRD
jgi:DNA-binding MarR family transcriptional regulator